MIRVQCPHCQRRYRTEMEAFGRTAVCSKCFQTFAIGESRPPFEWKQTDIAEDSWIGVEPPEEKKERKHCINCDAPLEPGAATCLACGANQITGLIERPKPRPIDAEAPRLSAIPLRRFAIVAAVITLAAGAFWGFRYMTRSAARMGDEITDQTLLIQAGRHIREGEDVEALARIFGGRVTDDNLPRFVQLLSSEDAKVRTTAAMLIGCGRIADVAPVVAAAEARETSQAGREAIEAIGVRRLVELSSRGEAPTRGAAARAMCLLLQLTCDDETLRRLAAPASVSQKTQALNAVCGAWPQGTGTFAVLIDRTVSPFAVSVEQVGRAFFLRAGTREFRSSFVGQRRFDIPLDQWCAATGTAVDAVAVRAMATGSITLAPIIGGGWEGSVRVTALRPLRGPLPGFLPVGDLERGRTIETPIRLQRPVP